MTLPGYLPHPSAGTRRRFAGTADAGPAQRGPAPAAPGGPSARRGAATIADASSTTAAGTGDSSGRTCRCGGCRSAARTARLDHPYWQLVSDFLDGTVADAPPLTDAGVWEALLYGDGWGGVDDRLARQLARAEPRLVGCAREHARFLGRALRWLTDRGVYQFIDLGCGLGDLTGHIGPAGWDDIRLACVDSHPLVTGRLRHRHRDHRRVAVIEADLRQPGLLLLDDALHETIDFGEPVAVLAVAVLQHLTDADGPAGLLRKLRDTVVTGSYLVLSHPQLKHPPLPVADSPELAAAYARYPADWTPRSAAQVAELLDGWTATVPGITQVARWRPDPDDAPARGDQLDDSLGWAVVAAAAPPPALQATAAGPDPAVDRLPSIR